MWWRESGAININWYGPCTYEKKIYPSLKASWQKLVCVCVCGGGGGGGDEVGGGVGNVKWYILSAS